MRTNIGLPTTGGHYGLWRRVAGLVFTAGLVPRDPLRNIIGRTIEDQTQAVLENLRNVLRDAECDLSDLIQVRVYLSDMSHFAEFNVAYAAFMGDVVPVRTTIGCTLNGVLIEVDAVAEVRKEAV